MSKQKPVLVEKISGKAKYNAVYLGWKECPGLFGVELTEPVIHDMVYGPRPEQFNFDNLPRLTIAVTKSELAITQTVRKGSGKTEKIKFQTIPMKNLTFTARGSGPDDMVVACIVVGYNPASTCWVHIHAYLCESTLEAETFLRHLRQFTDTPAQHDRLERLEKQMIQKGQIPTPIRPVEGFSELGPSSYGAAGVPRRGVDPSAIGGGAQSALSEVNIYGTSAEMFPVRAPSNPTNFGQPASEAGSYGMSAENISPRVTTNPMFAQQVPEVNIYGTSAEIFPARYTSDDPNLGGDYNDQARRIGMMQQDVKPGLGNPYGGPTHQVDNNLGVDHGAFGQNRMPRLSPKPSHRVSPPQRELQPSDVSSNQLKLIYNQSDDKRSVSPKPRSPNFDSNNGRMEYPNAATYTTGIDRQNLLSNGAEMSATASGNQPNASVSSPNAYRDYRQTRQEHPDADYEGPSSPPPVDYMEGPPSHLPTTIEDKLAAELKRKLGKGPILLPPKDYDTVNRTHGNLIGIEVRKCLNENIVGKGGENEEEEQTATGYRPNTRPGISGFGYS